MLFINKLFNSIACLLSFTNLQLVIPGRTWILLYLGRTVYKRLWACLALYEHWWLSRRNEKKNKYQYLQEQTCSLFNVRQFLCDGREKEPSILKTGIFYFLLW